MRSDLLTVAVDFNRFQSTDGELAYAPPHSKGPGLKTYILTIYALSAPVRISAPASAVNREILLAAMKDHILTSAELKVIYDRTKFIDGEGGAVQNVKPGAAR